MLKTLTFICFAKSLLLLVVGTIKMFADVGLKIILFFSMYRIQTAKTFNPPGDIGVYPRCQIDSNFIV